MGGMGGTLPSKNTIPFPPLPPSQFGKMLWGWEHEAFVLVRGKLAGLGVNSADSSVNVPAAACPISVLTPRGNGECCKENKGMSVAV